ncbi:MAG: hypothetical protein QOE64_1147 [Frankiales bacterium]|jgi:hypothetical protein|nr:hypothetical protein [Frankiales bacterium]
MERDAHDGHPVHDGAQTQLDDGADPREQGTSTPDRDDQAVQPGPTVPTAGQPTGDSTTPDTSPPGVPAASARQPAVAVPGKPDGEVDTRV